MHRIKLEIVRAWYHHGLQDRIHYIVRTSEGRERHLYADRVQDPGLYKLLHTELGAVDYTGPKKKATSHGQEADS